MVLLVLILKQTGNMEALLKALAAAGVKGATVVEGTGMAEALVNMEELPMFGLLRHVLSDAEREPSHVMLVVLPDELIATARRVVHEVIGDLSAPNTGILFTLPVTSVEGMGD